MKKIVLGMTVAMAVAGGVSNANAAAANACTGTAGKVTISGTTTDFVKTSFQTPCSANVTLNWDQTTSAAFGASASSKGACVSIGHTDAGVRPKTATCSAASPDSSLTPAAADAANMGSS